jgi:two-component system chemotaxis response regulator CheB
MALDTEPLDSRDRNGAPPLSRVIVIGASAGGIEALRRLIAGLPENFPAAVFVVQHMYREAESVLPEILSRAGALPVEFARHESPIEPGRVYVAPVDYHLLLTRPGLITLDRGPRENLHRPAIDPTLRSAARTYGPYTVGVILSGTQDDGSLGMLAVKLRGGRTVVQDPADAAYPGMPLSVLEQVEDVDFVLPVAAIPELLVQLVGQPVAAANAAERREPVHGSGNSPQEPLAPAGMGMAPAGMGKETRKVAAMSPENRSSGDMPPDAGALDVPPVDPLADVPDVMICPECGGALRLHEQGQLVHFRCHTGHAFGIRSLDIAYSERVEHALWAAMSALKERAVLSQRLAQHNVGSRLREEYQRQAEAAWGQARVIEELLAQAGPPSDMPAPHARRAE